MEKQEEFHLGLCLAGAISTGAYTARVLEYLIEPLDEWGKRKQGDSPNMVPLHSVKLSVIGGASAGGMTGMIAGLALHRRFDPIISLSHLSHREAPASGTPFYHAWVDMLDVSHIRNPYLLWICYCWINRKVTEMLMGTCKAPLKDNHQLIG